MKKRLIILSDLWGKSAKNWENQYIEKLKTNFEIQYYDCCKLGKIHLTANSQDERHEQFINSGIDIAVNELLQLEKKEVFVLAFSIGGTIAWKSALKGLLINTLIALSATRLRHENEKPHCNIQLIYGAEDSFQPNPEWFERMNITPQIIARKNHDFYQHYIDFEFKF